MFKTSKQNSKNKRGFPRNVYEMEKTEKNLTSGFILNLLKALTSLGYSTN